MPLNLQIPYQAPSFEAQGLGNLGAGIGEGIQKLLDESAQTQMQAAKNDTLYQHLKKLNYISPEDQLAYQKGGVKQRQGIVEGAVANLATDQIQKRQQAQNAESNALANYHNTQATPFSPTQVSVPPPAGVPGGRPITTLMTSPNSAIAIDKTPVPANAGKTIQAPSGQWVIYDERGHPTPLPFPPIGTKSRPAPDTWDAYAKDLQAASGGNPLEWANSTLTEQDDGGIEGRLPKDKNGNSLLIKLNPDQRKAFDLRYKGLLTPGSTGKAGADVTTPNVPRQISTQADYDALPSGTPYIAPDGSSRTKP